MIYALTLLISVNCGFGVWSHKRLRAAIQDTNDTLVCLITGKVREEGPAPAAKKAALTHALEVRAVERRAKPITLNL